MSIDLHAGAAPVDTSTRAKSDSRFRVHLGCFEDASDRAVIDFLTQWIETTYAEDLRARPSKHVYIRRLPVEIERRIDQLRDSRLIHEAILRQFSPACAITPMKHTDELYISHYNRDNGGDQGLFEKHYDGNLRFLPFASVVRALIYLQSDSTYTVVFDDSKIERAFTTYEFGLLDFHRELHWVKGEYNPTDKQRILLKCNYLVCPRGAGWLARIAIGLNTAVFYVVKAAMEYSKSPKTPMQHVVGWSCNLFRLMNNVHPFIPIAFILVAFAFLGWGLVRVIG